MLKLDKAYEARELKRLRAMMEDPRYWKHQDPAYVARVRQGFEALYDTPRPRAHARRRTGAQEQSGHYVWHTIGDGRVRSSHADRDGKVFSWNAPPEGGHPGEAPNCRCWAEDVEEKGCERIKEELNAAYRRHDALHSPIENAKRDIVMTEQIISELENERLALWAELPMSYMRDGLSYFGSKGRAASFGKSTAEIKSLVDQIAKTTQQIEIEKHRLSEQKTKRDRLEEERNKHASSAAEYSRRYQECIGNRN